MTPAEYNPPGVFEKQEVSVAVGAAEGQSNGTLVVLHDCQDLSFYPE